MLEKLIEALSAKFPDTDLSDIEAMAKESLGEEINNATAGLRRTNEKLLTEKKRFAALDKALEGMEPEEIPTTLEELKAFKAEREKLEREKLESKGQYELLLKRATDKYEADRAALAKQLEAVTRELHETLRDNALKTALSDIRVRDEDRELIESAYRGRAVVKDLDGRREVLIPDRDGLELPIGEYFKTWAQSDQGKRYIKAPDNSGGGARGSAGGNGSNKNTYTRTELADPAVKQEYRKRLKNGEDVHITEA